jgi:hypothetical protein
MKIGALETFAHGDVGNGDIFDVGPVDAFEREAAGAVEDDVRDGDVAEVAFGFGADLDAARGAVAVGRLLHGAFVGGVEQRADVETADQAVGDGDVLAGRARRRGRGNP